MGIASKDIIVRNIEVITNRYAINPIISVLVLENGPKVFIRGAKKIPKNIIVHRVFSFLEILLFLNIIKMYMIERIKVKIIVG